VDTYITPNLFINSQNNQVMAKPILVVRFPYAYPESPELGENVRQGIKDATDNEYHVLLYFSPDLEKFEAEALNYVGKDPINEKELETEIMKIINHE